MTAIVHECREQFDTAQRKAEVLEADTEDLRELEQVEKKLSGRKGKKDVA